MEIARRVRCALEKKILFLPHAVRQMSQPERMISTSEVRRVVQRGEVIEVYPDDARGSSCLMFGFGEGDRSLHVVCAPKEDYLAIITAYLPSKTLWEQGFRVRRSK
jgi:hypothetical protein